ncbi:hypothetical protein IF1G_07071 [Cordyceps javanica]|uniref:Uncharacterized protein n=1 Tax=Cordyceps javanica TaxID=43265 RepID=A0A545UXJ9_9HYPO|nr:hypothetical protein IF1G_07071 [Cordyceps javanica]
MTHTAPRAQQARPATLSNAALAMGLNRQNGLQMRKVVESTSGVVHHARQAGDQRSRAGADQGVNGRLCAGHFISGREAHLPLNTASLQRRLTTTTTTPFNFCPLDCCPFGHLHILTPWPRPSSPLAFRSLGIDPLWTGCDGMLE